MDSKAWSGNALFDIYGDRVELTLLGSEEFPTRYALSPDDVYDLATAAFLTTALILEETPAMPMNVKHIDDVLVEMERFKRAAEAAKTALREDAKRFNRETAGHPDPDARHADPQTWALIAGSKETGTLRRSSLDLTRALSELRRPR